MAKKEKREISFTQKQLEIVINKLAAKHGEQHKKLIYERVFTVYGFWRKKCDGKFKEFEAFCLEHFTLDEKELGGIKEKIAIGMEHIFGYLVDLYKALQRPFDLEMGKLTKTERMIADIDVFSPIWEQFFVSKLAFLALLNFDVKTTEDMLMVQHILSKKKYEEMRLTDTFRYRGEEEIENAINLADKKARHYIMDYNIWSHAFIDDNKKQVFGDEPNEKLISHWALRDKIKALYHQPGALKKQSILYLAMQRIVKQRIPETIVNDEGNLLWSPQTNKIYAPSGELIPDQPSEPDTRYQILLEMFKAESDADHYFEKNFIERSFWDNQETLLEEFEIYYKTILRAPCALEVAKFVEKRLGRKLRPFDIWYNKHVRYDEAKLDKIALERYPDVHAFKREMPDILRWMGFKPEEADFISSNILVEKCRGSGHAYGSWRRGSPVNLRTREPFIFHNFKTAMHELGHCAEGILTLHDDSNSFFMRDLPNTGFSEAFAFTFEDRAQEWLGEKPKKLHNEMLTLYYFWKTFETAGVALLNVKMWEWMYANKKGLNPSKLRNGVIGLAKAVWNEYFAPLYGKNDIEILAIYSHLIENGLYFPNYLYGDLAAFQFMKNCEGKDFAEEMKRVCSIGMLSPNAWMRQAVGDMLSGNLLVSETEKALEIINAEVTPLPEQASPTELSDDISVDLAEVDEPPAEGEETVEDYVDDDEDEEGGE